MLHIERPSGRDISGEKLEITIRDENGLRAATIFVRTREVQLIGHLSQEEVVISIDRPRGETSRLVFEAV